MILNRLGNKNGIAKKIIPYFSDHKAYVEMFFGAGGLFFNKPKVKHNFVNDLDSDVFNLYWVILNRKEDFIKEFDQMPINQDLFKYWRTNNEDDQILKAVRFLFLSNFGYMGSDRTMRFRPSNEKLNILSLIDRTFDYLKDVQFLNVDFRKVLKSIDFGQLKEVYVYLDPPYLETSDNYSNSFKEEDVVDLLDCVQESGFDFGMSEFDQPFILDQAKKRGLNVIYIGERRNIDNRRTEILLTNYKNNQQKLF